MIYLTFLRRYFGRKSVGLVAMVSLFVLALNILILYYCKDFEKGIPTRRLSSPGSLLTFEDTGIINFNIEVSSSTEVEEQNAAILEQYGTSKKVEYSFENATTSLLGYKNLNISTITMTLFVVYCIFIIIVACDPLTQDIKKKNLRQFYLLGLKTRDFVQTIFLYVGGLAVCFLLISIAIRVFMQRIKGSDEKFYYEIEGAPLIMWFCSAIIGSLTFFIWSLAQLILFNGSRFTYVIITFVGFHTAANLGLLGFTMDKFTPNFFHYLNPILTTLIGGCSYSYTAVLSKSFAFATVYRWSYYTHIIVALLQLVLSVLLLELANRFRGLIYKSVKIATSSKEGLLSPYDHLLNDNSSIKILEPFTPKQRKDMETGKAFLVDKLSKTYPSKNTKAIDNFSGCFFPNEIYVLLGHNGAGKSTAIECITNRLGFDTGKIYFGAPGSFPTFGLCSQEDYLYDGFTLREALYLICKIKSKKGRTEYEIVQEVTMLLLNVDLLKQSTKYVKDLSGGQKRRFSFAAAFAGDSDIIFLDEPTSGVDPMNRHSLWKVIEKLKKDKIVLITTHYMDEAIALADRIGIMSHGKMFIEGKTSFIESRLQTYSKLKVVFNNSTSEELKENKSKTIEAVKGLVKNVYLASSVAQEIRFNIPFHIDKELLCQVFELLENKREEFNLSSYSHNYSSLEEIFMQIALASDLGEDNLDKLASASIKDRIIVEERLQEHMMQYSGEEKETLHKPKIYNAIVSLPIKICMIILERCIAMINTIIRSPGKFFTLLFIMASLPVIVLTLAKLRSMHEIHNMQYSSVKILHPFYRLNTELESTTEILDASGKVQVPKSQITGDIHEDIIEGLKGLPQLDIITLKDKLKYLGIYDCADSKSCEGSDNKDVSSSSSPSVEDIMQKMALLLVKFQFGDPDVQSFSLKHLINELKRRSPDNVYIIDSAMAYLRDGSYDRAWKELSPLLSQSTFRELLFKILASYKVINGNIFLGGVLSSLSGNDCAGFKSLFSKFKEEDYHKVLKIFQALIRLETEKEKVQAIPDGKNVIWNPHKNIHVCGKMTNEMQRIVEVRNFVAHNECVFQLRKESTKEQKKSYEAYLQYGMITNDRYRISPMYYLFISPLEIADILNGMKHEPLKPFQTSLKYKSTNHVDHVGGFSFSHILRDMKPEFISGKSETYIMRYIDSLKFEYLLPTLVADFLNGKVEMNTIPHLMFYYKFNTINWILFLYIGIVVVISCANAIAMSKQYEKQKGNFIGHLITQSINILMIAALCTGCYCVLSAQQWSSIFTLVFSKLLVASFVGYFIGLLASYYTPFLVCGIIVLIITLVSCITNFEFILAGFVNPSIPPIIVDESWKWSFINFYGLNDLLRLLMIMFTCHDTANPTYTESGDERYFFAIINKLFRFLFFSNAIEMNYLRELITRYIIMSIAVYLLDYLSLGEKIIQMKPESFFGAMPTNFKKGDSKVKAMIQEVKKAVSSTHLKDIPLLVKDAVVAYCPYSFSFDPLEYTYAVRKVNFLLEKGDTLCLLGHNGCGKSSLIKAIMEDNILNYGCVYSHGTQRATFFSKYISQLFRQPSVGYCPQEDEFLPFMTVKQQLYFIAINKGVALTELKKTVDSIISICDLHKYADFQPTELSKGNKRKASMAIAMVGLPAFMLLDEPSCGIDALGRYKLWSLLRILTLHNISLIYTTHLIQEAESLATKVTVMNSGTLRCYDTTQNLIETYGSSYSLKFHLPVETLDYLPLIDWYKENISPIVQGEFFEASLLPNVLAHLNRGGDASPLELQKRTQSLTTTLDIEKMTAIEKFTHYCLTGNFIMNCLHNTQPIAVRDIIRWWMERNMLMRIEECIAQHFPVYMLSNVIGNQLEFSIERSSSVNNLYKASRKALDMSKRVKELHRLKINVTIQQPSLYDVLHYFTEAH